MNETLEIARLTILEARRRRTFLAGVILSLIFFGGMVTMITLVERASNREAEAPAPGAEEPSVESNAPRDGSTVEENAQSPDRERESRRRGRRGNRMTGQFATQGIQMGGLWIMRTFAALIAMILACGSIAPEKESGTLYTLVTKPIRRSQIILGKWLGLNAVMGVYVLILGVVLCAIIGVRTGEIPWAIMRTTGVSLLMPTLFVTLGILFSVVASTWIAVGLSMFSWGVGAQHYGVLRAIGVGMKQMGYEAAAVIINGTAELSGYIVPTGKIGSWISRATGAQSLLIPGPVSPPTATWWDLLYVFVYLVVVLGASAFVFQRRDL
ncbi:MAG: ABC transporter permease [Candidatus Poribacteria bacterium]|nr:ABC transporter permease [Candidatus Poribacteria bacterium]